MSVTVVTSSLPTRTNLLAEAAASVQAQTVQPAAHLIGVDYARRGGPATLTALARAVETPWLAVLDDDDLLDPHHLQTLLDNSRGADIIYSYCRVEGRPGWNPNRDFDEAALQAGNYIPITTLIRSGLVAEVGGWRAECPYGWWDWDFWLRALAAGATFRCVPEVTWTYRFHGSNVTFLGAMAA